MLPRLSLPRAALMASSFKSGVGRLADRLLTGWSLVRIRPGEPNKIKWLGKTVRHRWLARRAQGPHLGPRSAKLAEMASGEGCEETAMVEQDQRDAAAILSMIEGEFRRAIEAEREFLDWRRASDASFGEQLHRFAEYIHASEPCQELPEDKRDIPGAHERTSRAAVANPGGDVSETSRTRRVSDACQAATRRPLNPVSRHRWL